MPRNSVLRQSLEFRLRKLIFVRYLQADYAGLLDNKRRLTCYCSLAPICFFRDEDLIWPRTADQDLRSSKTVPASLVGSDFAERQWRVYRGKKRGDKPADGGGTASLDIWRCRQKARSSCQTLPAKLN